MYRRHWLDYDPVALAVLLIGIGMIELFAVIIWVGALSGRHFNWKGGQPVPTVATPKLSQP